MSPSDTPAATPPLRMDQATRDLLRDVQVLCLTWSTPCHRALTASEMARLERENNEMAERINAHLSGSRALDGSAGALDRIRGYLAEILPDGAPSDPIAAAEALIEAHRKLR